MGKVFLKDYINKIIFLEKRLGTNTTYLMLNPFTVNTRDIMSIQNAARKIGDFIGLNDVKFIVIITAQQENVGGKIELIRGQKEVIIEVSKETVKYEAALLSTLAHEITHKFLNEKGLSVGDGIIHQYENEILTDIATVFLGLGKIMLNGCECRREYEDRMGRTTEIFTTGYLNMEQLSFVYYLICTMRRIHPDEYERGLSKYAISKVRESRKSYCFNFADFLHEKGFVSKLFNEIKDKAVELQLKLFLLEKRMTYIQKSGIESTLAYIEKTHKEIAQTFFKFKEMNQEEYDPCLVFFNNYFAQKKMDEAIDKFSKYCNLANQYNSILEEISQLLIESNSFFPKPSSEMYNLVICRNDGTRFKIPQGLKGSSIVCPTCNYTFIADDDVSRLYEKKSNNEQEKPKGFLAKFFQ